MTPMNITRREKMEFAAACLIYIYVGGVFLYLSPVISTLLAVISVALPFVVGFLCVIFAGTPGKESNLDSLEECQDDAKDKGPLPDVNNRANNIRRRCYSRRDNGIWRKHKCRPENDPKYCHCKRFSPYEL
jgi:hypothetical protein